MSQAVELAKAAREKLASALNALQTEADVPEGLMDVAEPIAVAMGVLHRVERSRGADLEGRDKALDAVRRALDLLQKIEVSHPAVDACLEAVASSLAKVHALTRVPANTAPGATAPASPSPGASPGLVVPPAPVLAPVPVPASAPTPSPVSAPRTPVSPAPSHAPQAAPQPAWQAPVAAPSLSGAKGPGGTQTLASAQVPGASPAPVGLQPGAGRQPGAALEPPPPAATVPEPAVNRGGTLMMQKAPAGVVPQAAPQAPQQAPQQAAPTEAFPAPHQQPQQPVGQAYAPPPQAAPQQVQAQPFVAQAQPVAAAQSWQQPAPAVQTPAAQAPAAQAPAAHAPAAGSAPAGSVVVELGAHSVSNFYKGLAGNDVIEHGGIFVGTYKVPKLGTPVMLRVLLPGDYEFQASGVVQWVREGSDGMEPGFGAKLTQITPEGRQLVYRYARNREPLFYDDL